MKHPANLTYRYWTADADAPGRAEIPERGMVRARKILEATVYGPRGPKTRMGIRHRLV